MPMSYLPYHILCSHKSEAKNVKIIMTEISEEEENKIDNIGNNTLQIIRGSITFNITGKQIYCYGEVDFDSQEDLDVIENFNFLNHLGSVGISFVANYDYNEHACYSDIKGIQWTETWSPSLLAQFAHATLGKPQRILLFKQ